MQPQDHPAPTAWIGIDVSQDTLDACLLPADGKPRRRSFANDPAGHAALIAWADDGPAADAALGFCLESTGAYGQAWPTPWPGPAGASVSSTRRASSTPA